MTVAHVESDFDQVEETALVAIETNALAAITKTEVEAQLDSAHKYPRSINRFRQEALSMATVSEEVAQSCIYSLPRGGKPITGPSVRLAEICASAWGNIHVGARPIEVGDTEVTSQGVAWDLQKNYRVTVESKRRITGRDGKRFNDDMIIMTQNAANSIALRNAIFRVIPRAYVDQIYAKVREVAVGNASTLAGKRATVLERLAKMGADQVRVLSALGKVGVDDIGLEELETLIGYGTAIKDGGKTVDELFPAPTKDVPGSAPAEQGKRMTLGKPKAGAAAPAAAKPADAAKSEPAADPGAMISTGKAAVVTPPAAKVEPPKEQRMSTSKQRSEIAQLATEAKMQINVVCGWVGKQTTTELWFDEAETVIARIKATTGEVDDKGDAPTAEELAAAEPGSGG